MPEKRGPEESRKEPEWIERILGLYGKVKESRRERDEEGV